MEMYVQAASPLMSEMLVTHGVSCDGELVNIPAPIPVRWGDGSWKVVRVLDVPVPDL